MPDFAGVMVDALLLAAPREDHPTPAERWAWQVQRSAAP
jgi:hypothetical protein